MKNEVTSYGRPGPKSRCAAAAFLLAGGAAAAGCTGHEYRLPSADPAPGRYETVVRASETATGAEILRLIPVSMTSKVARATEELLRAHGGHALADVTVRERWYWALLFNLYKIDVTATVLREKQKPATGGAGFPDSPPF